MDRYSFEYIQKETIQAESPAEAFQAFFDHHPHADNDSLKHVAINGRHLGYEYSKETGERIWFVPGCSCNENDCIHDPMRDIAQSCAHQSDMTADRWESCSLPDPCDCNCYDYDNECK